MGRGRAQSPGHGCASEDGLLPWLLPSSGWGPQSPPRRMASWEQLNPGVQSIPASSEGVSEDSVSSREAWSVPVAKGLPSWASSKVSGSCLGVEGSLCATRGSPSGLHALLSASARKFSCQLTLNPFLPAFIHARSNFLGSTLSQAWCGTLHAPTHPGNPFPEPS